MSKLFLSKQFTNTAAYRTHETPMTPRPKKDRLADDSDDDNDENDFIANVAALSISKRASSRIATLTKPISYGEVSDDEVDSLTSSFDGI